MVVSFCNNWWDPKQAHNSFAQWKLKVCVPLGI